MEPSPTAASVSLSKEDKEQRRRRTSWQWLMAALVLPAFIAGAVLILNALAYLLGNGIPYIAPVAAAVFIAVVMLAIFLGGRGPARGWNTRLMLRAGWSLFVLSLLSLVLLGTWAFQKVKRSSLEKSIQGNLRPLSSAEDQYVTENPSRIFLNYDDLVGPGRYIGRLLSADGEDYHVLFPHQFGRPWVLTRPDGKILEYNSGIDGPSGPKPDGVHVTKLEGGRRFETTWRGGVPDGPFHAYRADGSLWGEATYVQGRVSGPSWIYLADGSRFNELDEAQRPGTIAAQKLAARDFAGALKEFNRALELQPDETGLLHGRATAREALGDPAGALADLEQERAVWLKWRLTDEVKKLDPEIARVRKLKDAAPPPVR